MKKHVGTLVLYHPDFELEYVQYVFQSNKEVILLKC